MYLVLLASLFSIEVLAPNVHEPTLLYVRLGTSRHGTVFTTRLLSSEPCIMLSHDYLCCI